MGSFHTSGHDASQSAACGVTTDRQTALGTLLALIRMHTVDCEGKNGGERNTGVWQVNFPPIKWIGWEKGEHVCVKQSGFSVWVSLKNCASRHVEVCFGEAFLSDCVYLCAYVSVCVLLQNTKSQWYSQSLQTRSMYFIASLPLPVRAHYSPWKQ